MQWLTGHADAIMIAVYLIAALIFWRVAVAEIRRRRRRANRWLTGRQALKRMREREARERKERKR